jgi:hypothetical protein
VPKFLFDPGRVERLLAVLPRLQAVLPPPREDSEPASSFDGGMKNRRAVYRLLANPHYPHLRRALRAIDCALVAGDFGDLLTTGDYAQFAARLSEVRVADHFLLRDFSVAVLAASGERAGDLRVVRDSIEATLEVYSPRVWLALADWETAVVDELKNVDQRLDYAGSADARVDARVPPWEVAAMVADTAEAVLNEIAADFAAALARRQPYKKTYRHGDHPLETTVQLESARDSDGPPRRWIAHSGPGYSGYSPAGTFRRIIERQVYNKAGRRQAAAAPTGLRGLVVDLSRAAGIADDLRHPAHRQQALEVLAEVDPVRFGLDFIIFASPVYGVKPPRGLFADFNVYEDTRVSRSAMEAMFKVPAP